MDLLSLNSLHSFCQALAHSSCTHPWRSLQHSWRPWEFLWLANVAVRALRNPDYLSQQGFLEGFVVAHFSWSSQETPPSCLAPSGGHGGQDDGCSGHALRLSYPRFDTYKALLNGVACQDYGTKESCRVPTGTPQAYREPIDSCFDLGVPLQAIECHWSLMQYPGSLLKKELYHPKSQL